VIPGDDPRLRPHGQIYEDLGEILIDPSSNLRYNQSFRANWGANIINREDPIDFLNYFLLLFPMTFLVQIVVPNTNNNLREARKPVTFKAEMLRFFGLTLSMALDPTRGGINSYWDDNVDLSETIYQKKCYYARFNMTRHRFQDLRRYLSFGSEPEDIVSAKIIVFLIIIYNIELRSLVFSPSFYRCF